MERDGNYHILNPSINSLFEICALSPTYLILLKKFLILKHVSDSGWDWNLLPGLESLSWVLNGFIEFSISCLGDMSDEFLSGLKNTIIKCDVNLLDSKYRIFELPLILPTFRWCSFCTKDNINLEWDKYNGDGSYDCGKSSLWSFG